MDSILIKSMFLGLKGSCSYKIKSNVQRKGLIDLTYEQALVTQENPTTELK